MKHFFILLIPLFYILLSTLQVFWADQTLYKELRTLDQSSAKPLEDFLDHYKKALHPKHRFFVEAKFALIKFYGNYPNYRYCGEYAA